MTLLALGAYSQSCYRHVMGFMDYIVYNSSFSFCSPSSSNGGAAHYFLALSPLQQFESGALVGRGKGGNMAFLYGTK